MNKNSLIYDKISDDVLWLSTEIILRMNVTLSSRNQDGTRRSFYSEYEYDSKYIDKKRATSIKRSFGYYLSLESTDKSIFIQIYPSDIYALRDILLKVSRWILNSKLFVIVDNKLSLARKVKPEEIILKGKVLGFEPTIIRFSEEVIPGIRFTYNSERYYDISADKFMGFKYIIDTIDMYLVASNMVNFIQIPPYGTNLYQIQSESKREINEIQSNVPKRQFKESRSYFDKLDNM